MNRNRLRHKFPLLATLAVLTLVIAGYIFGLAYWQSLRYELYDFEFLIEPRLVDATIAAWLIYFCSSIGSFLNVVAWRMPRGEGIGGRSRCPRCANLLKTRDNVPILGWISLRGRCRFCSLPISRRYPIVEALVGITLTVIGIAELYSLSLPGQEVHFHDGPIYSPRVSAPILAILSYHTVAVSTLWAMALIRIDGTRLPRGLIGFAAVAVILPMLCYPMLMVVPWQASRPPGWFPGGLYVDAVMRVITALVTAAFFGRVLAKGLCPTADLKLDPLGGGTTRLVDLIAMLSIPCLVIGWQSMAAFLILAAVLSFVLRPLLASIPINDGPKGQILARGSLESFAFAMPFALTLHIVLWRVLWSFPLWPSDQSSRNVMIVSGLLVLLLPLVLKRPAQAAVDLPIPVALPKSGLPSTDAVDSADVDSADELPDDEGDQESDDGDEGRDDSPGA